MSEKLNRHKFYNINGDEEYFACTDVDPIIVERDQLRFDLDAAYAAVLDATFRIPGAAWHERYAELITKAQDRADERNRAQAAKEGAQ